MQAFLPRRNVMKRIFGVALLAALLSAGTLSIAGDASTSQTNCEQSCPVCPGPCPVPCGMCG
jgi:hypothetical protein